MIRRCDVCDVCFFLHVYYGTYIVLLSFSLILLQISDYTVLFHLFILLIE